MHIINAQSHSGISAIALSANPMAKPAENMNSNARVQANSLVCIPNRPFL